MLSRGLAGWRRAKYLFWKICMDCQCKGAGGQCAYKCGITSTSWDFFAVVVRRAPAISVVFYELSSLVLPTSPPPIDIIAGGGASDKSDSLHHLKAALLLESEPRSLALTADWYLANAAARLRGKGGTVRFSYKVQHQTTSLQFTNVQTDTIDRYVVYPCLIPVGHCINVG